MKTFKEHILEKLKVTKSSGFAIPTYKDFFDLLDEYCKKSEERLLDLNEIIDADDPLPIYTNDGNKHIYTLTPLHSYSPILRLRMYDFTLKQSSSQSIYINHVKDEEVDFMQDEYIEKAVNYMKEHIK